ncbi:MAG: 23S rRNA (adenine(2503)-C(2))-methyltransferase RlmN [Clostridia bacterium]|nr:23S rRNA (adenine(2503)-C(2))-methyltransferase RlmN [Clostridia bacterium]
MLPDILSMYEDELTEFVIGLGEEKYRGKQLYKWLHTGAALDQMSDLPKKMREKLALRSSIPYVTAEKKQVSEDGTVKYLFRCFDGEYIESVFMTHDYGNTVCVSSQAGCRMGCRFCASTLNGLQRSLYASEMLSQVYEAQKDTGKRVSNIVIMGMGEPFDNYDNVVRFIRLINSENGANISCRHISLSTCGIVDGIKRFAGEGLPVTLSVSLHSPNNEKRNEIMPVNRRYPIEALLPACREYFEKTGRRISFEYALIDGKNNSEEDAKELASVLKSYIPGMAIHVNLIPVNPIEERDFRRGSRIKTESFVRTLEKNGVNATVRRRLGSDIDASCGQLRARKYKEEDETSR